MSFTIAPLMYCKKCNSVVHFHVKVMVGAPKNLFRMDRIKKQL